VGEVSREIARWVWFYGPAWFATKKKIAMPKIWQEKLAKTRLKIFTIDLAS
jgi:hypothetical protein